jgi:toxin secretion/phage lysis holin
MESKMAKNVKAVITVAWGVVASMFGALAVPMCLLVLCNVIDYVTGIVASKYRSQNIDSYKGFKGIARKIAIWLLVVVGCIVDEMLKYAASSAGINIGMSFLIACVVTLWLVCNELISILENISDMGVSLPPFLMPLVKRLKKQVEDKEAVAKEADDGDKVQDK